MSPRRWKRLHPLESCLLSCCGGQYSDMYSRRCGGATKSSTAARITTTCWCGNNMQADDGGGPAAAPGCARTDSMAD